LALPSFSFLPFKRNYCTIWWLVLDRLYRIRSVLGLLFYFFSDLCVLRISCNSSQLIINPAYSMNAQTKTPQSFDPDYCCGRFKTGCFVTFVVWATSFNHLSMHLIISLLSCDLFSESKWWIFDSHWVGWSISMRVQCML
jgi:hypothetical protein